jgi:general L-amino acid transport system substrate-binding protein
MRTCDVFSLTFTYLVTLKLSFLLLLLWYSNNLESIIPRDNMNRINTGESGLLYAFPFGDLSTVGPQVEVTSPTIAAIKERGFLRCGVNVRKGFAHLNATTRTWSGFDVELCRALAAALFDGADDRVVYVDLPAAQRFQVLADKRVDCLARLTTWTLTRDVQEPSIGHGLTFTAPYFYDGVTFGGIPEYLTCAENQDLFSPICQSLKFCILEGTTGYNRVQELFREDYISPRLTFDDIVAGLNDGSCNAVAGGLQDVAMASIREKGYLGPYGVGVKRYSKDPLAITTRQDDPVWSDFVRWVFWALLYAEEQGITQETAFTMPRTTLFGPLRTNMFAHAVNAVGSYGELYDRNFADLITRGGVHSINVGTTPQMVSLPGF